MEIREPRKGAWSEWTVVERRSVFTPAMRRRKRTWEMKSGRDVNSKNCQDQKYSGAPIVYFRISGTTDEAKGDAPVTKSRKR